jgi:hypothetical protein
MKILVLSDHTATRQKEIKQGREKKIASLNARIAEEKAKNDLFWANKRYFRYIFGCLVFFVKTMPLKGEKTALMNETEEEKVFTAGSEGEKKVDDLFMSCPDNFIFIAGYKNFKGEIDRILVCPHGVLAIEIKNLNGRITVIGDEWSKEKYDRWNNLVESDLIQDRGGRSPSEQVNQSADILHGAEFKRMFPKVEKVARMALFTHEKSEFVEIRNATVDMIEHCDLLNWNKIAAVMPNRLQEKRLTDEEVGEIAAFIEKDHNYHEQRRKNNRRR